MPATMLFGNGFNRVATSHNVGMSWDDLLVKMQGSNIFESKGIPSTLIYERIVISASGEAGMSCSEEYAKNVVADIFGALGTSELYKKILALGFDNYLTTNYDHAFELTIAEAPVSVNSSEELYSIRRKKEYKTDVGNIALWHIHGDIDNPKSIMLGLDHYCGSVSKIDAYIKGNYTFTQAGQPMKPLSIRDKVKTGEYDGYSWVELFFRDDIHILGLSLDYSETDLWWVLARRARMQKNGIEIRNKIYFHTKNDECEKKVATLNSLNVEVCTHDFKRGYALGYEAIIESLR